MIAVANRVRAAAPLPNKPAKPTLASVCREFAGGLAEATRKESHHAVRGLLNDFHSLFSEHSAELSSGAGGAVPCVTLAAAEPVADSVEALVDASGRAPIEEVVGSAAAAARSIGEACRVALEEVAESPLSLTVARVRNDAARLAQRLTMLTK